MDSSLIPIYQLFKDDIEQLEIKGERDVHNSPQRYKDLDLRALYTGFADLENIFQHPSVKGRWVDIGGGSGRSCLLYSFLYKNPSVNLEIDPARAVIATTIAQKYRLETRSLVFDLMTDPIPEGDTFFLYFPTGMVLDRVLDVLSQRLNFTLVVIESHGDLIARIAKEEGYRLLGKIPLLTPRHDPFVYFYHKEGLGSLELSPHKMSFREELIIIQDQQGEWVASSLGLEWLTGKRYQLLYPPRTICWEQDFLGILDPNRADFALLIFLNDLRKRGDVKFVLGNGKDLVGVIRKIRISPVLALEISTSELLEWSSIKKITQGSYLCYESSASFFSLPAP